MTTQVKYTWQFCFSIILVFNLCVCTAQVKDSIASKSIVLDAAAKVAVDSFTKKADSISILLKKKKFTINKLYVGMDPSKLVFNLFDSSKTRIEGHCDVHINKNVIVNTTFGYVNARLNNARLNMNTNSIGASADVCKSLFSKMGAYDFDFAFIGVGYGFSLSRISDINYNISDLWGTYSGTIPATTKGLHWLQLSAGFMMQLHPKVHAGWRVHGKAILNQSNLQDVAPLYSAPYGAGDKATIFGYNLMLSYRIK
jgi:Domain of unknown function (DUF6048)